jgi:acid phosphatase (class A)
VIFTLKQRYNRVRPSFLRPEIGHLFPIPGHPAYPSGHATQAFAIAYLLQELDPDHAGTYRADALRIGRNREIAGLHYPSDTDAGQQVARQVVDALLGEPRFLSLLKSAKAEWR